MRESIWKSKYVTNNCYICCKRFYTLIINVKDEGRVYGPACMLHTFERTAERSKFWIKCVNLLGLKWIALNCRLYCIIFLSVVIIYSRTLIWNIYKPISDNLRPLYIIWPLYIIILYVIIYYYYYDLYILFGFEDLK